VSAGAVDLTSAGTSVGGYSVVSTGSSAITGSDDADILTNTSTSASFTGGTGADTFVATAATMTITDLVTADIFTVASAATVAAATAGFTATAATTNAAAAANVVLTGSATAAIDMDLAAGTTGYTITGGTGANTLTGSDFADVITGGTGIDTILGGTGIDIFIMDQALVANANNIGDFAATVSGDSLHFSIGGVGLAAADYSAGTVTAATVSTVNALASAGANNHIIVDTASNVAGFTNGGTEYGGGVLAVETDTGRVLFDADGDFSAGAIAIGTLTITGTLDLNNFDIIA